MSNYCPYVPDDKKNGTVEEIIPAVLYVQLSSIETIDENSHTGDKKQMTELVDIQPFGIRVYLERERGLWKKQEEKEKRTNCT